MHGRGLPQRSRKPQAVQSSGSACGATASELLFQLKVEEPSNWVRGLGIVSDESVGKRRWHRLHCSDRGR
jgi:hypothetical protein